MWPQWFILRSYPYFILDGYKVFCRLQIDTEIHSKTKLNNSRLNKNREHENWDTLWADSSTHILYGNDSFAFHNVHWCLVSKHENMSSFFLNPTEKVHFKIMMRNYTSLRTLETANSKAIWTCQEKSWGYFFQFLGSDSRLGERKQEMSINYCESQKRFNHPFCIKQKLKIDKANIIYVKCHIFEI